MAKIEEMKYDGLITDIKPHVQVGGGMIAGGEAEKTYVRGTVMAVDDGGYLVPMADGLTPNCILCDDTVVGTEDVHVTVYTAGCFDGDKVTVSDGYTLTDTDKDELRMRNIVFKDTQKM